MIDVQNKHIWFDDSTKKEWSIQVGSTTFTNSDIIAESVIMEESINSTQNIDFANVEGSYFEFILGNIDQDKINITRQTVTVTLTGILGNETSVIPMGKYIAEKPEILNDNRVKVKCYDYMTKFDKDVTAWWKNLGLPMHLNSVLLSLCNYVGVSLDDTGMLNKDYLCERSFEPKGLTGREVLSYIGQLSGGWFHFDRQGVLKIYKLQNKGGVYPSTTLYPSSTLIPKSTAGVAIGAGYKDYKAEDYQVQRISKLNIAQENGDIFVSVGTGTNEYNIQSNPLLFISSQQRVQSVANNVYYGINFITYNPLDVVLRGLPYIEVGDYVELKTRKDKTIKTYVLSRSFSGTNALNDNYVAKGDYNRSVPMANVDKSITRLSGKVKTVVDTVDTVSWKLEDLDQKTSASFSITNDRIVSEVSSLNTKIGTANDAIALTEQTLRSEIAQTASSINLSVASTYQTKANMGGYYTKEETLSQISVKANEINLSVAGTYQSLTGMQAYPTIDEINSAITLKADEINLSVSGTYQTKSAMTNYYTKAETTASINIQRDRITAEVTRASDAETTLSSRITLTESAITSKVSKGEIASTINQTAQSVKISAAKIDLNGYVTISSLGSTGTTVIDGSRITTGTIDASKVTVKNLNADYITAGYFKGDRIKGGTMIAYGLTFSNATGSEALYNSIYQNTSNDLVLTTSYNFRMNLGGLLIDGYTGATTQFLAGNRTLTFKKGILVGIA